MDSDTNLALIYLLLLRQGREQERNLRCEKCNPPKYKVNEDDSSTDYSTEYECECSSNQSSESESDSSEQLQKPEYKKRSPDVPVAQSKLNQNQPRIPAAQPGQVQQQPRNPFAHSGQTQNQLKNPLNQPRKVQSQLRNPVAQPGQIQRQLRNPLAQPGQVQHQLRHPPGQVKNQLKNLVAQPRQVQRQLRNPVAQPVQVEYQLRNLAAQPGQAQRSLRNPVAQHGQVQQQPGVSVTQPRLIQPHARILAHQTKLAHNQSHVPGNHSKFVNNQVILNSKVPLQIDKHKVMHPQAQLNQGIMSGRPTLPQTAGHLQKEYFLGQNKLPPFSRNDSFAQQKLEIEYWVRTHRPPCTYGLPSTPVLNSNTQPIVRKPSTVDNKNDKTLALKNVPAIVKRRLTFVDNKSVCSENSHEEVKPLNGLEIAADKITKTPLTFVDGESLKSEKSLKNEIDLIHISTSKSAKPVLVNESSLTNKSHTDEMNLVIATEISPETITDDKTITKTHTAIEDDEFLLTDQSRKTIYFSTTHNSVRNSGYKINENQDGDNSTSLCNMSGKLINKPTLRSSSTPNKRVIKKPAKMKDLNPSKKGTERAMVAGLRDSIHESPIRSSSAPISRGNIVTRNKTRSKADETCDIFQKEQQKNKIEILSELKEPPEAIAGPSNASMTRRTREMFDDSDTSVLTAPYIRSTRNNTSKSRCHNLSRQRASQAKVKNNCKRNNKTEHDLQPHEVSKLSSEDIIFDTNKSNNEISGVPKSTNSSLNDMTPPVTRTRSCSAKSSSLVLSKRTRTLHFTQLSVTLTPAKRKSEPVIARKCVNKPRKLLSKSCNINDVDVSVDHSNDAMDVVEDSSGLQLSSTENSKNMRRVSSMLDGEDEVPVRKKKFFA